MIIISKIKNKIKYVKNQSRLKKDFVRFSNMLKNTKSRFPILWKDRRLIYEDTNKFSFDPHYIYHPAWAARILAKTKPKLHVDISLLLDFSTLVSAFIPVKFYDYRPANIMLDNMTSQKADLLNLPFKDESVDSISCMHVIEHVGLARYGDNMDPDGDIKSMKELSRVLSFGGTLLFVVPVGKPRIQFNAHRIYAYEQILEYFKDLTLKEFVLIPDDAKERGMVVSGKDEVKDQVYGCGCFWFTKK